jgi:hypothetical protein
MKASPARYRVYNHFCSRIGCCFSEEWIVDTDLIPAFRVGEWKALVRENEVQVARI